MKHLEIKSLSYSSFWRWNKLPMKVESWVLLSSFLKSFFYCFILLLYWITALFHVGGHMNLKSFLCHAGMVVAIDVNKGRLRILKETSKLHNLDGVITAIHSDLRLYSVSNRYYLIRIHEETSKFTTWLVWMPLILPCAYYKFFCNIGIICSRNSIFSSILNYIQSL